MCVMTKIKFGTDGWRAVVGKDFNAENVSLVTSAIGKYVYETFGAGKRLLSGMIPEKWQIRFRRRVLKFSQV